MEQLTFTCKILTPMFLAGADGKTPELRAASIKGALRFWWRAMQREPDINALKAKEDAIFGGVGSSREGAARRSKVIVRLRDISPKINGTFSALPRGNGGYLIKVKHFDVNILEYLAFGTYERDKATKRNKMVKGYFPAEKRFEIKILCPGELKPEILRIMALISQVGGIGAKSRNGFGRFTIEEEMPKIEWQDLFQGNLQDYTSFSSKSKKIEMGIYSRTPLDVLAELGKAYKEIRGKLDSPHVYSNRKYLGAPLMEGKINRADLERHGKPIFFGISPTAKGEYQGYFLVLPYNYLGGKDKHKTEKYHQATRKFIENAK